jgi:hypothetical protein
VAIAGVNQGLSISRTWSLTLVMASKRPGLVSIIAICKIVDSFSRKHYHKNFAGKKVAFSLMLWK